MLGKNLFIFDNLSDAELIQCYHQSRAVIFPSIVEGFGLPIVEALAYGKKTLVSDTPIHREVGQGNCSYFDLSNPGSLCQSIEAWENQLENGAPPPLPTRTPITWKASTETVLRHCIDAFHKTRNAEEYCLEYPAACNTPSPAASKTRAIAC